MENEIKYFVEKGPEWYAEPFIPKFTIGVQTFSLQPVESEERAKWYLEMLEKAHETLVKIKTNE